MVFISEKLVLYDLFICVAAGSAAFLYWGAGSWCVFVCARQISRAVFRNTRQRWRGKLDPGCIRLETGEAPSGSLEVEKKGSRDKKCIRLQHTEVLYRQKISFSMSNSRRRSNLLLCWHCEWLGKFNDGSTVLCDEMWHLVLPCGSPFIMLVKGSVYWPTNSLLRRPVWSRTQKRMRQSSGTLMMKFMSLSQWGLRAVRGVGGFAKC